jgi:hypothetical protein
VTPSTLCPRCGLPFDQHKVPVNFYGCDEAELRARVAALEAEWDDEKKRADHNAYCANEWIKRTNEAKDRSAALAEALRGLAEERDALRTVANAAGESNARIREMATRVAKERNELRDALRPGKCGCGGTNTFVRRRDDWEEFYCTSCNLLAGHRARALLSSEGAGR